MERDERFATAAMPFFGALYSAALRLTRNPHDAEDIVQETYLRAFRAFDRFEHGTNLRAWLYAILHNVVIDAYRKTKRSVATDELKGDGPPVAPTQTQCVAALDIEAALAVVPEVFRMAVILRDIEDLSYGDIAAILNVPAGTVMSRIHRGRLLLRAALRGSNQ